MKKGLAFLLGIFTVFSLTACGADPSGSEESETSGDSSLAMTEEVTADTEPETSEPIAVSTEENNSNILIVYFSRWGNTEYPDDVDATTSASIVADGGNYGTTEYVARMIQENVGGELHFIQTQEPYPVDFDELRDLNHSEMAEGYLPALVESNLDISGYDTVFIGYPVWATEVPQAVLSFLNEYDFSGKTVIPFCTHDGYGAGSSYNTIREASHAAESPEGLAIEAKDVPTAENTVAAWLEEIGITRESIGAENEETAITITIGDIVLDGVIYDTALAQEIKEYFPLTISMNGYGGREYYGGVDFYPAQENLVGGGNTFDNGDITYCEAHHNMAIFYAQTYNPVLTVDVIPIGRVTSDLSVFENLDSREEITFSLAE
jgi:flavodoxin